MSSSEPRIALVLAGGGARGAYEAGVVSYVLTEVPKKLGRPVRFRILTGSSVGAIHACFLASTQQDEDAAERLLAIWRSLSLESVFRVGLTDLVRIPFRLLGVGSVPNLSASKRPDRLPSLLDTTELERLVKTAIDWRSLRKNIDSGVVESLAIVGTEIATGRSVVFVDNARHELPPWTRDPFIVARLARIEPDHALASAAIPLLFPAVRVGGRFYSDGGLRLNTPLVPALRLGADRVLIVGVRGLPRADEDERVARRREQNYTSLVYLAGKALDALLLDRIETDVDRLKLFNAVLETGMKVYGPDFLERINRPIVQLRNTPYRIVRHVFIRPSEDLGEIAAECFSHRKRTGGLRGWLGRSVVRYSALGMEGEADLASYLFFDRCYAEHLIELGRQDAAAQLDDLLSFFS